MPENIDKPDYVYLNADEDGTFIVYQDMSDITDSLQLDSNTTICELKSPTGYSASIEVQGLVKIEFDGEIYKTPSEFPEELKKIIAEGNVWKSDRVYVDFNNWFEFYFWDKNYHYLNSEVIDIEGMSFEKLHEVCKDWIKSFIKEEEKEL